MRRTTTAPRWNPAEVVPLADRIRYMRVVRGTLIVAVLALGMSVPTTLGSDLGTLARGTSAFAAVSLLAEAAWRIRRRRGLRLFGAMLLLDGLYLAWVSYVTGGNASPLRYLVLLHLIAVTLLASYRTGLKLAMWHSLLVFAVFYADRAGASPAAAPSAERLAVFVTVAWLATFVVAACSAANERELRRRRFDLEALADMASQLEAAADSLAAAAIVVDAVVDTFDARRAAVLAAPDGSLCLLAARLGDAVVPIGDSMPCGDESVVERARRSRATVLVQSLDADADPWLTTLLPSARNVAVLPLSAEGRWIGVLVVEYAARRGSRIERRVVSMLERFASHAGLALRNAWLLEQVQRLADTDGLTGIANRRTFEGVLSRELLRAEHRHEALSLVMLDIDNFKQLNDDHGHQAGDDVLREVANVLSRHCREFDTPARYGGEEFALILPRCGADEALRAAERLRIALSEASTFAPITVSLGVADFPRCGSDGDALVSAADQALYASKRGGRNRVTEADDNALTTSAVAS